MSTITTKDGTQIYYKDWGEGQPLFFHHGWPLSADDWDGQMMFFLERGYRVIRQPEHFALSFQRSGTGSAGTRARAHLL